MLTFSRTEKNQMIVVCVAWRFECYIVVALVSPPMTPSWFIIAAVAADSTPVNECLKRRDDEYCLLNRNQSAVLYLVVDQILRLFTKTLRATCTFQPMRHSNTTCRNTGGSKHPQHSSSCILLLITWCRAAIFIPHLAQETVLLNLAT